MRYNRGDVVLVFFPDSNLRTSKRRPALVVQRDDLNNGLSQTVIAMITSNTARVGHPSRVAVLISTAEGQRMGLLADSVIMTDNLATVLETEIDKSIGVCPIMNDVDAALRHTLSL